MWRPAFLSMKPSLSMKPRRMAQQLFSISHVPFKMLFNLEVWWKALLVLQGLPLHQLLRGDHRWMTFENCESEKKVLLLSEKQDNRIWTDLDRSLPSGDDLVFWFLSRSVFFQCPLVTAAVSHRQHLATLRSTSTCWHLFSTWWNAFVRKVSPTFMVPSILWEGTGILPCKKPHDTGLNK